MRRLIKLAARFLALSAMLYLVSQTALASGADPVAFIVNKENPVDRLDASEIRNIYTNTMLNWRDSSPIAIYDLAVSDPRRAAFSEAILGKRADRVAEEWAHLKITNQAKNPPTVLKSESLIIRKISRDKTAIGYVSLGSVRENPDVKVVFTLQ